MFITNVRDFFNVMNILFEHFYFAICEFFINFASIITKQ